MNPRQFLANAAGRTLAAMFPGYFGASAKHDHYADFGYPQDVDFLKAYRAYTRNGIANAAVEKTVGKTWEDNPFLQEFQRDGTVKGSVEETQLEAKIRQRFEDLRLWQRLAETDRRSLVGSYSGAILRLADDKRFEESVDTVPGGLEGLVEIIPAWEGQLEVAEYETDEAHPNYGQPSMFQFNEAAVDGGKQPRSFRVHPDRVIVWSRDGTVNGRSLLEPGYNDLVTLEKISGAGGEGFWKNAKSAPVLEVDKEADPKRMADAMGIEPEDMADAMDDQVTAWQKGFDSLLMLQGIQAKTLSVSLPSPEHFFAVALQGFAASVLMPVKILVGSQTGERASTEDAAEWSKTAMSRRRSQTMPNIMELVNRLERFRILPEKDWFLSWSDLTEASMIEKIERADKMADVNKKMEGGGELVFLPEEIRAAIDLEPLSEGARSTDPAEEDELAALGREDETAEAA